MPPAVEGDARNGRSRAEIAVVAARPAPVPEAVPGPARGAPAHLVAGGKAWTGAAAVPTDTHGERRAAPVRWAGGSGDHHPGAAGPRSRRRDAAPPAPGRRDVVMSWPRGRPLRGRRPSGGAGGRVREGRRARPRPDAVPAGRRRDPRGALGTPRPDRRSEAGARSTADCARMRGPRSGPRQSPCGRPGNGPSPISTLRFSLEHPRAGRRPCTAAMAAGSITEIFQVETDDFFLSIFAAR